MSNAQGILSLQNRQFYIDSRQQRCVFSVIAILCSDLEVLQQASAGDLAAVDLLHVDVARAEEPRDQNLQVV